MWAVPNGRRAEARPLAAWEPAEAVAGECAAARLAPAKVQAARHAAAVAEARLAEPVVARLEEDAFERPAEQRRPRLLWRPPRSKGIRSSMAEHRVRKWGRSS
jgi:hypothetical protein